MADSPQTRALVEVLGKHRWASIPDPDGLCSCGALPTMTEQFGRWGQAYREHLADAILAAGWAPTDQHLGSVLSRVAAERDALTAQLQRVLALADEMENNNTEKARVRRYWSGRIRAALGPDGVVV